MSVSVESRESYQPTITDDGAFTGGERDYQGRLQIIERHIDFRGKRVLDLGCSAGFYSFSIARKALSVTGVDGDAHMIERNRDAAQRIGCTNVEFLCERITSEFLQGLPTYDVVLFLSVFHHLLADSGTYAWGSATPSEAEALLDATKRCASIYVFEMGRPEESFHWSRGIKRAIGEPRHWVPQHVFGSEFNQVLTLDGPARARLPYRWLPWLYPFAFHSRVGRKLNRLIGIDQRDFREIYIGTQVLQKTS